MPRFAISGRRCTAIASNAKKIYSLGYFIIVMDTNGGLQVADILQTYGENFPAVTHINRNDLTFTILFKTVNDSTNEKITSSTLPCCSDPFFIFLQ